MKKIAWKAILRTGLLFASLLFGPMVAHAAGATSPHAVVMVCSSIGSAGTNLLTLYVQGISSDDPNALAAVGTPTQPPPGIECGAALANLLSLSIPDNCRGGGATVSRPMRYTIQSVISIDFSWIYTLTTGSDGCPSPK